MNSVKRHIYHVKNSRLGHYLPTSVKDKVILPFREGLIVTKFRENKTHGDTKISESTVIKHLTL